MILKSTAKVISLTDRAKWFRSSYQFTKQYAKLKSVPGKNLTKINAAIKLDALLALLSDKGESFPIPVKIKGAELFDKPRTNGLILCSAHMPLLPVALRAMIEGGIKIDSVILKPVLKDNLFPLFGTDYKIPIINNGPAVLLKAKRILDNNGIIAVLTDEDNGSKIFSPNIFRFVQKVKADIIYFFSELKPEGYVEISFFEAPKIVESDDIVTTQISALNQHRNRIFNIQQDFVIEKIG